MQAIISFILTIFFALEGLFLQAVPDKNIRIEKTDSFADFYENGRSEDGLFRFGVVGTGNLFEPGSDINVVIENRSEAFFSTTAEIHIKSEQTGFSKKAILKFGRESAQYTFGFSSELNGIFTVRIILKGNIRYSFNVGVIPRNSIASFDFYYGIQPYITRAKCWDDNQRIPGMNEDESVDAFLDVAEYMGVNLIREDGVTWGSMQKTPYGDVDFSVQDYLIGKANERGIRYNWIIGNDTSLATVKGNYKANYVPDRLWAYPPDEEMWADFAGKLAEHYADNSDIIYEIWNEPNWDFFAGTQEEYFSYLEHTASIIREKNPDAYIYSGGLAVAERDTNLPYFREAAKLISEGLLDNWGYHNHDGNKEFAENMRTTLRNAHAAGLTVGGINSESGINGHDASLIARKALYSRSVGSDGYVSFSFKRCFNETSDVNGYAFFNEYLQPSEAALAFSTVIRFLGHAKYICNRSNGLNIIADEYKTENGRIIACYSFGETSEMKVPKNVTGCYDMFGNPMETGSSIKITENPVYLITENQ